MISSIKPFREGWIFHNRQEAVLHLVAWPLYLSLMIIPWFYGGVSPGIPSKVYFFLAVLVYLPGIFYLNTFYLIPVYLQKKRWLKYGLALLGLMTTLTFFDAGLSSLLKAYDEASSVTPSFLGELAVKSQTAIASLFLISLLSFGYRFTVDWIVNIGVIEALKSEKYAMELAFLKSQVDPHFLFNTLNSLYALALEEKGDKTADAIAKLGTLMRYNLHDSQADSISVIKEVDYIQKYIELQRLRANQNNQIDVQIDIPENAGDTARITPMLLIPFVENAFKHGISATEQTSICIKMKLQDDTFLLTVQNSLIAQSKLHGISGIGLKNVQERLQLLYPGNHTLRTESTDATYKINLAVTLS